MAYHPPKMITNNSAPILSADLAYEAHGKCGCQTIILSDNNAAGTLSWRASLPTSQPVLPVIPPCVDYSNVYKILALANTKFSDIQANNIAQTQLDCMKFGSGGFILKLYSEFVADFTSITILSGTLILYRECNQS